GAVTAGAVDHSNGSITLTGGDIEIGGRLEASGNVRMEAGELRLGGQLQSSGNVRMEAGEIRIDGLLEASWEIEIEAEEIRLGQQGKVASSTVGRVRLTAGAGGMTLDGEVSAFGSTPYDSSLWLKSAGPVRQGASGAVKGDRLILEGDGAYTLTGSGNEVDK